MKEKQNEDEDKDEEEVEEEWEEEEKYEINNCFLHGTFNTTGLYWLLQELNKTESKRKDKQSVTITTHEKY